MKCEDQKKINFRQQHEETYAALWRSLLVIGKIDEALLFAAEQGLAQSLSDNLLIQYELASRPSSGAKFPDKSRQVIGTVKLYLPLFSFNSYCVLSKHRAFCSPMFVIHCLRCKLLVVRNCQQKVESVTSLVIEEEHLNFNVWF